MFRVIQKRINAQISLLLIAVMLLCALIFAYGPVEVVAASSAWDGSRTAVTPEDGVYMITTPSQLAWFSSAVGQGNTFSGTRIEIRGNFNFGSRTWTPISGRIDGDVVIDANITGISISDPIIGLFGDITLKNLSFTGSINNSSLYTAFNNHYGLDRYCAGLIAGKIKILEGGTVNINELALKGYVLPRNRREMNVVGCLFGCLITSANTTINISHVDNQADIRSDGIKLIAGGLIGKIEDGSSNAKINICEVIQEGVVIGSVDYGSDYTVIGGLIGYTEGQADITISKCATKKKVSSIGYEGYAGGFIGNAYCNSIKIDNSYVTGEIHSEFTGHYGMILHGGGMLGLLAVISVADSSVTNCYFYGTINSGVPFIAHEYSAATAMKNCYCKTGVAGTYFRGIKLAGRGDDWGANNQNCIGCRFISDEEFKSEDTFENWDFESIWYSDGQSPPELNCNVNCTLTITVKDEEGNLIDGSQVKLTENGNETVKNASNGKATFDIKTRGATGGVVVTKRGYDDYYGSFLAGNKENKITVILEKNDYATHPVSMPFMSSLYNMEMSLDIDWGLELLKTDPEEYNENIALAALSLSNMAYYTDRTEEAFKLLGFNGGYRAYRPDTSLPFAPLVHFAYRKAQFDNEDYNIFAIAVRGTSSPIDFGTDILDGLNGFPASLATTKVELELFMTEMTHKAPSELAVNKVHNIFLITGHSLGGAVANKLSMEARDYASDEAIFTYTYEPPHTRSGTDTVAALFGESHIHNFINVKDFVPRMPPWAGWTTHGQEYFFNSKTLRPEIIEDVYDEEPGTFHEPNSRGIFDYHWLDWDLIAII